MRWALSLLAFVSTLQSQPAAAFPDIIRENYPSCASCHVVPTGGGTLTDYGRGASEAILPTWGGAGLGSPLFGVLPLPEGLLLGGDQRGVAVTPGTAGHYDYIPMEESLELAVQPKGNPGLTLDLEAGIYGPDHAREYRRAFVKLDLTETLGIRFGHFTPAYGINLPDHTTFTRQNLGLGEGSESYNVELYWMAPEGELVVTGIGGTDTTFDLNKSRPGAYSTDSETGAAARAAVYLGSSATAGISTLDVSSFETYRNTTGVFATTALGADACLLAEIDRAFVNGTTTTVALLKAGYVLTRGLTATLQGDTADTAPDWRLGAQWIPLPHVEVTGELRRTYGPQYRSPATSGLLLFHHWI